MMYVIHLHPRCLMLLTTAYPTMPVGVVAGKAMMDGAWEGHSQELEMLAGQNALLRRLTECHSAQHLQHQKFHSEENTKTTTTSLSPPTFTHAHTQTLQFIIKTLFRWRDCRTVITPLVVI